MDYDVIPPYPKLGESEIEDQDIDFHLHEFKKAETKLMFYEKESGELEILFHKLDDRLYADMLAKLTCPLQFKVYEFLKLLLENVRLYKNDVKKGYPTAVRISNHLKSKSE